MASTVYQNPDGSWTVERRKVGKDGNGTPFIKLIRRAVTPGDLYDITVTADKEIITLRRSK